MPSWLGFKTGFKALLLIVACLSACLGTNALAGTLRSGVGGFTPVSEDLHGNARAPVENAPRSNSIRTDVNRYNAERSTRAPANQSEPSRQVQDLRNGYRSN
ncbi:hypothetical protein [Pararobbsia alpina]|nr:hypothetical protein [Pararobbsia alpina]